MYRSTGIHRPVPADLEKLRACIRRLESHRPETGDDDGPGVFALGMPGIDDALPWGGLPRAALHEILAGSKGAAFGFCAGLLGRLSDDGGAVLWCRRERGLYGPGLAGFGLSLERLILVRAHSETDVLWVLEEGLRSRSLAAVLGEVDAIGTTAARRLQLAAESSGVTAFLLRPTHGKIEPGPAVTRWRITPAPSAVTVDRAGVGPVRWRVDLLKCRSGTPGTARLQNAMFGGTRSWLVEWRDGKTACGFTVVADLCDRSVESAVGGGKGAARIAV
jgi:protein ImuA